MTLCCVVLCCVDADSVLRSPARLLIRKDIVCLAETYLVICLLVVIFLGSFRIYICVYVCVYLCSLSVFINFIIE